ncbi:MAG: AAA family ATPase, partial [Gammaproteobacteria bacterium]|nr:AAA family ATPase [Gammaproteobacteria bacterium]
MKKLPISITTFEKIRDPAENYLYIDKTELAYQLINSGTYYFLSRPRRFGKSLFVDTLASLFQGKKDYFKGLAIAEKWDWNIAYPVINLSLNGGDFSSRESIQNRLFGILKQVQKKIAVECDTNNDLATCFSELILNTADKYQQKVVILIDEYDKPILDNIADSALALEARNLLKSFYSVIKDNDQYLKFVFITGVSKFSKMNLFSGLNNLIDITTMSDYAT